MIEGSHSTRTPIQFGGGQSLAMVFFGGGVGVKRNLLQLWALRLLVGCASLAVGGLVGMKEEGRSAGGG